MDDPTCTVCARAASETIRLRISGDQSPSCPGCESEGAAAYRKPYQSPKLRSLGSVRDLTRGGSTQPMK